MVEALVDTVFNIKHSYALLKIIMPFLRNEGWDDPGEIRRFMKSSSHYSIDGQISLMSILQQDFESYDDPKRTARYHKLEKANEVVLEELVKEEHVLAGRIPVLGNGLSVGPDGLIKDGHDPFSNKFMASSLLLLAGDQYDANMDFLDNFVFFYIGPVCFPVVFCQSDGEIGIRHALEEGIKELPLKGIGFGSLRKFDAETEKVGDFHYRQGLFSIEPDLRIFKNNPAQLQPEVERFGGGDRDRYLEYRRHEVYLNKLLMSMATNVLFRHLKGGLRETLHRFGTKVPLFMEEGSDSKNIVDEALELVDGGRKEGYMPTKSLRAMSNVKDSTTLGICHPKAQSKLFGYLDALYYQHTGKTAGRQLLIPRTPGEIIKYESFGEFPYILLEEGAFGHPNAHDLARQIWTQEHRDVVERFTQANRVGMMRIEPRLVELMRMEAEFYNGFRSEDKTNHPWQPEIRGKEWLFPEDVGIFELDSCGRNDRGDFRGSEFGSQLPCTIENMIGSMPMERRKELQRKRLPEEDPELVQKFFEYHDEETLEPMHALRGTAIHLLSSSPMESLVHYRTLERAGLPATSSDKYCELSFTVQPDIKDGEGKPITLTFHPDCLLFLKHPDEHYDILVLDTKTRGVTPYPARGYLYQAAMYGMMIRHEMETHLKARVENIYTVFNHSAHFVPGREVDESPHQTYRQQRFSPITRFPRDHKVFRHIAGTISKVVSEKRSFKDDRSLFVPYVNANRSASVCDRCYADRRMVCNQLYAEAKGGNDIREAFNV